MKSIQAKTLPEFEDILEQFSDGALFRGQVKDYQVDGRPCATTSFDRHGCIPSEMAKWSRYASLALSDFLGSEYNVFEYSQALLQHYGWRSFFLDATSNPAVASWFAAMSFKGSNQIEMCEDYQERSIWLRKLYASYESNPGEGHVYILDRDKIEDSVGCFDLSSLKIEGRNPRFLAQEALILGPLRNEPLPAECYRAHVTADRSIFVEFAARSGFRSTDDVFPKTEDDPILAALLSLPWNLIPVDGPGPKAFRRSIELPEYYSSYRKIVSGAVAFYCGKMVGDMDGLATDSNVHFYGKVPELTVFGTPNTPKKSFPNVLKQLSSKNIACFEIDQLVGYSNEFGTARYGKGIYVSRHGENLFQLGEILVEHPGMDLLSSGLTRGWFYHVDTHGTWKKIDHEDQCQCKSTYTHEAHVSALSIIEEYLASSNEFNGIP